jgi:hypothetical protein
MTTPEIIEVTVYAGPSVVEVHVPGAQGPVPDITFAPVETGEPGTDAQLTVTGTVAAPVLTFAIPRGATGATGAFPSIASLQEA